MYPCHLVNSAQSKKNPFLGEELIWFANPNTPSAPEEGSNVLPFPARSGERAAPAPREGNGGEVVPLFDQMKGVVPGVHGDPEDLMSRHEYWMSLLSNYNQIQLNINYLHDLRKKLSDPKLIESPDFKAKIRSILQQEYQKMEQVLGTLPNTSNSLRDSIHRNIRNQLNTDRVEALRITDRLIAEATRQRKIELDNAGTHLKEDLTERAVDLLKKWQEDPPAGYEEYQDGWIEYCTKIIDTIQSQDLAGLDDGKKDSPVGNQLLQEAQVWWDKLAHMQDSYEDFKRQDTSQFTVENAEAQYEALKHKKDEILNPEVLTHFNSAADEVLRKGEETEAIIESKIREWKGNRERGSDIESLKASLEQLKEKMKELKSKKNIKEMVDTAFKSKKEVARFQVPNDEGYIAIPEGIEGQIEALKKVPMSTPGRRQAIRTLLESMKGLEDNIKNYKTFAEVSMPQALIDLDLFQKGIDTSSDKIQREIMFVNPFATLGHLWHSYTEAVKSNVETNEKRGAGYFQRDATKIFNHMPKIPVIENLSVIKSLTELSVNGAVEAEHAEHHRIGEYEKQYEAVPPDHLSHMAEEASDQWELQGCLKVLAKAGRINWYAPWLFKALNRYQKTVKIPEDRHWHMRNLTKSNELMRQAFVYIYRDEDVYRNLRNTNLSSYESKMGEYNKQWGGIAAEDGALKKRAEEILSLYESDHARGVHNSKANPIEFESIIRYGVEWGKMKMEDRLNLLVRGIASGLLPFDRGVNATDKNNNYPPYDYFDTGTARAGKPTYDDVLEWAVYAKDPATWDYFMHKADGVMNNKSVNERLIKTMTQGSHRLDHDDAAGISGYLTMAIKRDLLKQKTQGGYGMPATGLISLITGDDFWLRMFAEEYEKRSYETNKNEMIRFASGFMMMEGIMNKRVFKDSQDFFRLEPGPDRDSPPRFPRGGYKKVFQVKDTITVGGKKKKYNGNAGAAEILQDVAGKIEMLDLGEPFLLKKLLHNEIKTDGDAEAICAQLESTTHMFEGVPPKNLNDLYGALPKYFEYILEKDSSKMEAMVALIKSEHGRHGSQIEHDLEHDIQHVREAAMERGRTGFEPEHHGDHGGDHGGHGGHGGDHGGHGGAHSAHPAAGGEHPAEGHGAANNSNFGGAAAAHGQAVGGSTHGQHHHAA
jgi:hypothetical protein